MPNIRKPASFATWPPEKQQAWMSQMEELARQQAEIATETAAANKKRPVPGTERRRPRQQQSQQKPSRPATAAPTKPAAPTVQGTIRTIQDRQQMLQGLKGGGPVKKKKAVAKKVMAKGIAKRGMGRAMRGR